MTDAESQKMKNFEAKVRNLIASCVALQQENIELHNKLDQKTEELKAQQTLTDQYKKEYDNLKLAKMIEISESDFKEAKQKITYLVREVNACINMLNAQ